MSALTKFITYEAMEDAIVHSVSSETTGHPAEHAISPLEPNFAWQANQSDVVQHTFVIDLGKPQVCNAITFIHHETENPGPPVAITINILLQASYDGTDVNDISITGIDGSIDDLYSETIKVRTFNDYEARYWHITVVSMTPPPNYVPPDSRFSMLWMGRLHELDRGYAYPLDDTPIYPSTDHALPFGKVYRTGHSIHPHTTMTRTWMVTDTEYDVLKEVMKECNGTYRPFFMRDVNGTRRLLKFEQDVIEEELLDIGLYRVTCRFVQLPIVWKDKIH
jgi:hypothetical protein